MPQSLRHIDLLQAACAPLVEAPHKGQDCANIRAGYRCLRVKQRTFNFRAAAYGVSL